MTSRAILRTLLAALVGGAALVGLAPAQDADGPRISEVRQGAQGLSVLIEAPSLEGVRVGQTVEVRREGQTVGYGSVEQVFSHVVVAGVGTVVASAAPLREGDAVVFHDSGFTPPSKAPEAAPPEPRPPAGQPPHAYGRVVNVRDGVVLVDFGSESGLENGHEVAIYDAQGQEVGRLIIELLGARTGGGLLVAGQAPLEARAVVVGKMTRAGGGSAGEMNYVDLDFLGVVAELERPAPRWVYRVGVSVRRLMPGSPAQRAGLGRGDRIIAIDGIVVRDIAAVRERIAARSSDRLRVDLIRGDRLLAVEVVFTK